MYPKVVALDTDYTIFLGWLNQNTWGKGRGAQQKIQDNIEKVSNWEVRDRTNWNNKIRMYSDVPDIISDILRNGAKLAIVSRNTSKAMSDRALWYFQAKDASGNWKSLIDLVNYDEVYDLDTPVHFEKIKGWAKCHYTDMIHFDDNPINNTVEMMLGVTYQVSRHQTGLTWENYNTGINMWRRNKAIESPWLGLELSNYPNRRFLGYSGMDINSIELLEEGGRRHDRREAARWGYGMYVADDPAIAKYFGEWIKKTTPSFGETIVCEIWARDANIWDNMNKVFVPDQQYMQSHVNSGDASKIGWVQEDRDRLVAEWGVKKPYILFARHPNMGDGWGLHFPVPNNRRWTEMVVYPQIQEALIVVKRLSAAQLDQAIANCVNVHFEQKLAAWNVTVHQRTYQDFAKFGENIRK